jgi:hypothetical protein
LAEVGRGGSSRPRGHLNVVNNAARDALGTVCRLGPDIPSAARLVLWSRAFRWTQFLMTLTDFFRTELCVGFFMFSESLTESDSGARMVNTPGFCALLTQTWRLLVRSEHSEWRALGLQCFFAFLEEAGNTVQDGHWYVLFSTWEYSPCALIVRGNRSSGDKISRVVQGRHLIAGRSAIPLRVWSRPAVRVGKHPGFNTGIGSTRGFGPRVDAGTGTGWEFSTRAHSVCPTRGFLRVWVRLILSKVISIWPAI